MDGGTQRARRYTCRDASILNDHPAPHRTRQTACRLANRQDLAVSLCWPGVWAARPNHPEENRSTRTGSHPDNGPARARYR